MMVLIGSGKTLRKEKGMNRVYRGWFISKDPLNKDQLQAVKGKEVIIGTIDQIYREIDRRALEEAKNETL